MKNKLMNCPNCKKETHHRVKRKFRPGRAGTGAVLINERFRCRVCNKIRDRA